MNPAQNTLKTRAAKISEVCLEGGPVEPVVDFSVNSPEAKAEMVKALQIGAASPLKDQRQLPIDMIKIITSEDPWKALTEYKAKKAAAAVSTPTTAPDPTREVFPENAMRWGPAKPCI